jgi:uncharacterized membrane protein
MEKGRLETFSDGVIAIIITIMVLELKVPHEANWEVLRPLAPVLLSYFISFIILGIYWNNHHHLFYAVRQVNGAVLWANLHLLFWLSLIPFVTAWTGENNFAALPVALYGCVLLFAGVASFPSWQRIPDRHRHWQRCERQSLLGHLYIRNPTLLCQFMDCFFSLCFGGYYLADPRSAH